MLDLKACHHAGERWLNNGSRGAWLQAVRIAARTHPAVRCSAGGLLGTAGKECPGRSIPAAQKGDRSEIWLPFDFFWNGTSARRCVFFFFSSPSWPSSTPSSYGTNLISWEQHESVSLILVQRAPGIFCLHPSPPEGNQRNIRNSVK